LRSLGTPNLSLGKKWRSDFLMNFGKNWDNPGPEIALDNRLYQKEERYEATDIKFHCCTSCLVLELQIKVSNPIGFNPCSVKFFQ